MSSGSTGTLTSFSGGLQAAGHSAGLTQMKVNSSMYANQQQVNKLISESKIVCANCLLKIDNDLIEFI